MKCNINNKLRKAKVPLRASNIVLCTFRSSQKSIERMPELSDNWLPLHDGELKINFDAAVS